MKELRDIAREWPRLERAGQSAVLATVVRTRGSTYRKAGARMLMSETEWLAGAISGGCLERDVLRKAWWRTREGRALITYDGANDTDDELGWGFGLGCEGSLDVLLQRLVPGPVNPVAPLLRALQSRETSVVSTILAPPYDLLVLRADGGVESDLPAALRDAVAASARLAQAGGALEARVAELDVVHEIVRPPPALVIFGSNYDALPLVRLARELGWDVTVCEQRPRAAMQERFAVADRVVCGPPDAARLGADSAVVIMTHSLEEDQSILRTVLGSAASYVGLLGPRVRTQRVLDAIDASPAQRARVHGPIGLDLGGRSPEEVALSIVAEIQAHRHARSAASLRARA